ncbi:hypothetical protein GCM10009117_15000 [Gangjinia marincola]|uniref:Secretion system C-terminal sorting domain-containing protein n=1 Tax=Gangjinia marincola TaxID=578463 RepID=A0ABN1MGQ4_9FLAO
MSLSTIAASAQWNQVGQTIEGDALDDNLGLSVSISGNGTVIAMGAPENDNLGNDIGQVKIYSFQNDSWVQMGSSIYGENSGDKAGESISMNDDGTRIAIGARFNDDGGSSSGHVRVYEFNGVDWIQLGDDIDGDIQADAFGRRVALTPDGNRLAVGIPFRDDNGNGSGQIRVYDFNGTNWIQIGNVMNGSNASDKLGWSLSISNDGNTLASGGFSNNENGYARIYKYNGTNWLQKGDDITYTNNIDSFGENVALSSSGDLLAVSARRNDDAGTDTGKVKVYKYNNDIWEELGQDINGQTQFEYLGQHVEFNDDENLLAISSWGSVQGEGKIYFYEIEDNSIVNTNAHIMGQFSGDFFGWSFGLNQLGNQVVVGRPGAEPDAGNVTVFKNDTFLELSDLSFQNYPIEYFPNPTGSILHIKSKKSILQLSIYDYNGKLIAELLPNDSIVDYQLNVEKFPNGVYFMQIEVEDNLQNLKFIKGD